MNIYLLVHIIGIIIALGAVTVIDTMGFTARKSKEWTKTTIKAHHITKPLIWLGTIIAVLSWLFLYDATTISNIKSILLVIMVLNGSFLSFYVSPRLDKLYNKNTLLPTPLQQKIMVSMIISFISWWSFVVLTVWSL